MTLLEIKHAIDGEYDKGNYVEDILYDEYNSEDGIMKKWLQHFSSFNEYIHYFMLDCFVRDGEPINIITGETISEMDVLSYKEQYKKDKIGQLQNLTIEELLSMLVRLETLILERTRQMEEYLKTK